jgi:hypothetical protein
MGIRIICWNTYWRPCGSINSKRQTMSYAEQGIAELEDQTDDCSVSARELAFNSEQCLLKK